LKVGEEKQAGMVLPGGLHLVFNCGFEKYHIQPILGAPGLSASADPIT